MAYRNIFITNPCKISTKNEQFVIDGEIKATVPIEDINCVLIENPQVNISVYTLSKLAEEGVCVFTCDNRHMPCGVLMPFNQHSRQLQILEFQIAQTKPAQKQLWKQIVAAKVENQAKCLEICGKDGSEKLFAMAKRIGSGDPENIEGTAAAFYFKSLFGAGFSRTQEGHTNAMLNYGYAILRGVLARDLACYGFQPSLGIHHCSDLNAFNLADDLIEPFRPIVDLFVALNEDEDAEILTKEEKARLFNLLNAEIISKGEKHSVAYAMERTVKSLNKYYKKEGTEILLPELVELKQHSYE